jgi:acetyltransferase-like isoleucine patch superfamily enzyme
MTEAKLRGYLKRYLKAPHLFFRDWQTQVVIALSARAQGCHFEGKNRVYAGASVMGSLIGRGTYVGQDSQLSLCKIGRYCSIGPQVLVVAGKHPVDEKLSTHPCFYSTQKQAGFTYVQQQYFDEFTYVDSARRFFAEIGNDVWIGARVTILEGVAIGNGAVVAAGSVVCRNVADFEIVAGVPAKRLRLRFDEHLRAKCLADPWWEKDEDWIRANLHSFTGRTTQCSDD